MDASTRWVAEPPWLAQIARAVGRPQWALVILLLAGVAGCGPIEYVNQVTRKASASVNAAKAAQAETYSPYYFTLAVEYLHKAREEAARADFQAANRFGRQSEAAAHKAKAEAIERVGKPIEQFHPNHDPAAVQAPASSGGSREPVAPLLEDEDSGNSSSPPSGAGDKGNTPPEADGKANDKRRDPGPNAATEQPATTTDDDSVRGSDPDPGGHR